MTTNQLCTDTQSADLSKHFLSLLHQHTVKQTGDKNKENTLVRLFCTLVVGNSTLLRSTETKRCNHVQC